MVKKTIKNTLEKEHYPTDVERLTEVYQHQEKRRCENIDRIIEDTIRKCKRGNGEEKEKCFRDFCRSHAEGLYPKIGEQAYAVPPFQIHSSKTSEKTVGTSTILRSSESESDFRGLTGQRTVGQRFRALNRTFEKSSREKCMFIIIDYVMDNFMRRFYKTNSKTSRPSLEDFFKDSKTGKCWVGCPDDSDEETKSAGTRSNQDLIILHEDKGLLFVQIKSVQKNTTTTDEAVVKSIKDGQKQLLQDVSVLKKCLRKSTPQSVTKVLALPNLRKQQLDSIKQIKGLVGKDVKLLLADHLCGDEDFGVWWEELDKKRLGSDKIKEIVGRYLGLFSTPQQLQAVNERHHVRDHCDALLFTGRLFKRLIFTEEQIEILRRHLGDNKQNVYISGPPGSGKTLMLIQRSKLFLNSDSNMVIVLDAYRGRKGRAVGEFIVQTLEKCYETDSNVRRKVKHLPLDISDKDDCQHQLKKFKKRMNVMFIIDEMFSHPNWESILQALHKQSHCFWCAGIDPEFPFKGIKCTTEKLTSILRCPPSVKKVLSQVDWEESRRSQDRCDNSESEVTERGTEGPIPLCIRHEKHVKYSEQKPINCPKCAEELVDIFQKKLKLIHTETSSTVRLPCSIVILYNIPRNEYQNTESRQVEITKTNFDKYSKTLSECTFRFKLQENLQKYTTNVHTVLKFEEDLMKGYNNWDKILFTWLDTFQGLERDIVVYLPGDGKISQIGEERPVPGVQTPTESETGRKSQTSTSQHQLRKRKSPSPSSPDYPKVSKHDHSALETEPEPQPSTSQHHSLQVEPTPRELRKRKSPSPLSHAIHDGPSLQTEPEPQPSTSQERVQSRKPQDRPETSDRKLRNRKRGPGSPGDHQEPKPKKNRPESEIEPQSQASTSQNHSVRHGLGMASMMINDDDIQRYSQWDQTNLFLAASRCCAQLIMIVP